MAVCAVRIPLLARKTVITGFNTDIEYQGTTYHVQTEDKGLDTPLILSLVYDRGTILASKRSPYEDLLVDFDENVLAARLQKQHQLICAAIRAGRIEDLKRMTAKDSEKKRIGLVVQKEVTSAEIKPVEPAQKIDETPSAPNFEKSKLPAPPETRAEITEAPSVPNPPAFKPTAKEISPVAEKPPAAPKKLFDLSELIAEEEKDFPLSPKVKTFEFPPVTVDEPIIEAVEIIEEEILPADAVAIIGEATRSEAPSDNRMKIEILGNPDFRSGEKKTLSISVHRGSVERGVAEAQIMIKVLGAAFRPLIFHSKTDSNGIAVVHLQMPLFKAGRAAVLIKAMSGDAEAEYRKTISLR